MYKKWQCWIKTNFNSFHCVTFSSRNDRPAMVPITQKDVIATIPSSYYSHRSLEAATVNGGQMSHFSADVHRNGIGGGHGGGRGGRRRRGRWLRRRNRRSRTRGRRNSAGVVISSSRLPALEDQNTLLVLTNFDKFCNLPVLAMIYSLHLFLETCTIDLILEINAEILKSCSPFSRK